MSRRPNFLLFITDQHRADFLGCYGHPVLRTPHIDSIAAKGTAFDRFYVASPVCMPNRSSLMTCRMPSVHGVRSNGIPLSMNSVTFVDLLREAGYRTALIGKSHLQNFTAWPPIIKRPPPREGYHEPAPELAQALRNDLAGKKYEQETPEYWNAKEARVVTPFYGFDHVTLVRAHGDEPGGDYDRWLEARDPKAKNLLGPKNALPHDYKVPQAYRTAIPEELYATSFLGERGEAYLNDADPDAPFFLMVSFPDPHHPFNPPGKYWDMYKPDQFAVPEAFKRNDWTPPALVQAVIDERAVRQGQSHRHEHHRRVGPRGAGGEGAHRRHDRLRRRRGRPRAARAGEKRPRRRHGGDVHLRPRRPSRRSPADAQGRRAISEHRAGAVHLVRPAGPDAAQAHRCARLHHRHRRDHPGPREDRAVLRHAGEEPAAGVRGQRRCATACSSSTTISIRVRARTACRRACIP